MATTYKRNSTRSRAGFGSYSGYYFGSNPSPWGKIGGSKKSTGRSSNKRSGGSSIGSTAYRTCCNSFEQKIDSYKTLCEQTRGAGSAGKPTPATLNSFANWINKGAIVQTCTPTQVSRWARAKNKNFNPRNPSPTSCKNVLTAKFGRTTIKAVARTKSGQFMVATTPTVKGRSFCFPQ